MPRLYTNEHTLKFADPLANLIAIGEKTTTWRLNNTRLFQVGDRLSLLHKSTLRLFAVAAIDQVIDRTFKTLSEDDYAGHEAFETTGEMLETYARYYNQSVGLETPLTVIHFTPHLLCTSPGSDDTDVMIFETAS